MTHFLKGLQKTVENVGLSRSTGYQDQGIPTINEHQTLPTLLVPLFYLFYFEEVYFSSRHSYNHTSINSVT